MSRRIQIAPSILTADFGRLADEVRSVAPLVDWFHLDVMDGHYVPNITFGPDVVGCIREATDRPLHVHLMISEPLRYAERFAEKGASRISFHPEVVEDVGHAVEEIRGTGAEVGIAIHPDVALEAVDEVLDAVDLILVMSVRPGFGGQSYLHEVTPKIARARALVDERGLAAEVEVDGGVNLRTLEEPVGAGADILVAGSAIFDGQDAPAAARALRERLDRKGDEG